MRVCRASRAQGCTADAAIVRLAQIRRPYRERRLAVLMREAERPECVPEGLGYRIVNWPLQTRREYDGLPILRVLCSGDDERSRPACAERSAEEPVDNPSLLRRAASGEGVPCIQTRIAKNEVALPLIPLRRGFRHDLDAPAPWLAVRRRVRVLIDLDLLDGGRADF